MANVVNGKVDSSGSRTVPTKTGRMAKVYDLYVDGVKYGFGFKDPATMGISPGTVVNFAYDPARYNSIDMGSLVIRSITDASGTTAGPSSAHTSTPAPAFRGKADRPFPVPVTSGEYAIIRQNALTNARELVAVVMGYNDTSIMLGDDQAWDGLVNRVLKIAYVFEDYSSGQREVKEAMKLHTSGAITRAFDRVSGDETSADNS